jgi:hypothetical protein
MSTTPGVAIARGRHHDRRSAAGRDARRLPYADGTFDAASSGSACCQILTRQREAGEGYGAQFGRAAAWSLGRDLLRSDFVQLRPVW